MAARLHRRPKAPSRNILLYLARQIAYISGLRDRRLRERHLQRSAVSPSTVAQGRRFSAQRIHLLRRWPPYMDAQSSELRQAAQHRMNSATAVTIPPDGIRPVGPPHPERLYQRFARFPSGSATLSQDPHSARMDQLPQVHRNMAP
jgi:hypothetical protein